MLLVSSNKTIFLFNTFKKQAHVTRVITYNINYLNYLFYFFY